MWYSTLLQRSKAKMRFWFLSRDYVDILAGYGTIALEILQDIPLVEAIIVPVGTGGLAAAIATVIKHKRKKCLIYVCTNSFMRSFLLTNIDMNISLRTFQFYGVNRGLHLGNLGLSSHF